MNFNCQILGCGNKYGAQQIWKTSDLLGCTDEKNEEKKSRERACVKAQNIYVNAVHLVWRIWKIDLGLKRRYIGGWWNGVHVHAELRGTLVRAKAIAIALVTSIKYSNFSSFKDILSTFWSQSYLYIHFYTHSQPITNSKLGCFIRHHPTPSTLQKKSRAKSHHNSITTLTQLILLL